MQLRGHCFIQTGWMAEGEGEGGEDGDRGTREGRKDEMRDGNWGWELGYVWSDLWMEIEWRREAGRWMYSTDGWL